VVFDIGWFWVISKKDNLRIIDVSEDLPEADRHSHRRYFRHRECPHSRIILSNSLFPFALNTKFYVTYPKILRSMVGKQG